MHVQDVAGPPWRLLRAVAVLLVLGAVVLAGAPAPGPPSPELRLASTADPAPPGNVTVTPVSYTHLTLPTTPYV